MPKSLTHSGTLEPLQEALSQFAAEVRGLGEKLGVLLVHLPPSQVFNESVAKRFFRELHKHVDAPIACEPRHFSWRSHSVARVAADPPPWPGANGPSGCKQIGYFRWHGQPRKYYSDYDSEKLELLWQKLAEARTTAD